jgi:hypothetical protein
MAPLMLALLLNTVWGMVCWRGEQRGNLGLDLSLLGQETLQSFFVGQRVVEPWVGHVERLSLHTIGRVQRWFGRGLECCGNGDEQEKRDKFKQFLFEGQVKVSE